MGPKDTIYFDEDEYRHQKRQETTESLRRKYYAKGKSMKTRNYTAAATGVASVFTMGTSLAATGYALRQGSVLKQQRKVIKEVIESRGKRV
jgi:hypothetical protein